MCRKKKLFFAIGAFLFILMLPMFIILFGGFKVKATEITQIDYSTFEKVVYVVSSDSWERNCTVLFNISDNDRLVYDSLQTQVIIIDEDGNLNVGSCYLIQLVSDGSYYDYTNYMQFDSYLNYFVSQSYQSGFRDGYASGVSVTDSGDAYNAGVSYGVSSANANWQGQYDSMYSEMLEYARTQWQAGYDAGVDNTHTEDLTIWSLFTTIIMFPIRILTEGFNVELFGVNIGGFLLAFIAISLVLIAIKFFLGKKGD